MPYNASWCLKKILGVKNLALPRVTYEIGSHSMFRFWHDPWFENKPLIERFNTSIISLALSNEMATVGDFISDHRWDLPTSNHVLLIELRSLVSNACIHQRDALYWNNIAAPQITLSTIWNTIRTTAIPPLWVPAVWQPLSIPKCAFLLWMAFKNRLFTRDRLISFGINTDGGCVLCTNGFESTCHIFSECRYSKVVLHHDILSGVWADYLRGDFFVPGIISKARRRLAFLFLSVAVYLLWRERNDRIHKVGHANSESQIRVQVQSMVREILATSTWFEKQVAKDPSIVLELF